MPKRCGRRSDGLADDGEGSPRAQVPDVGEHADGHAHRKAWGESRTAQVRDTGLGTVGFATGALALATPGAKGHRDLNRFPRRGTARHLEVACISRSRLLDGPTVAVDDGCLSSLISRPRAARATRVCRSHRCSPPPKINVPLPPRRRTARRRCSRPTWFTGGATGALSAARARPSWHEEPARPPRRDRRARGGRRRGQRGPRGARPDLGSPGDP